MFQGCDALRAPSDADLVAFRASMLRALLPDGDSTAKAGEKWLDLFRRNQLSPGRLMMLMTYLLGSHPHILEGLNRILPNGYQVDVDTSGNFVSVWLDGPDIHIPPIAVVDWQRVVMLRKELDKTTVSLLGWFDRTMGRIQSGEVPIEDGIVRIVKMFSNVGRMDLVDALNVYMPSRHYLLSYSSEEGHMSLRLEGPYGWAETFIDDDAPSAVQLAAEQRSRAANKPKTVGSLRLAMPIEKRPAPVWLWTKELGHEVRVTNPKADVVRSES